MSNNAYKDLETISEFNLQKLKQLLDTLPLFEIVERTENRLVVRQNAKNCISMQDLIKTWEMEDEHDDLVTFRKIET